MIKIFNATDTDFDSNGNIVINPLKCVEVKKKSLNGWYINVEVDISYKEYIKQDILCVIKSKSKLNPQAFRVKNLEFTQRKIIFQAEHVMFDSRDYFLLDSRVVRLNGVNALNHINNATDTKSPFKVYSDVGSIETAYFIRKNLLEAWTIIEERWNGIFDADNWNITFSKNIGEDRGEVICYGKNLQGISVYEDWSNVCTKLYPIGSNELKLPENFIESDVIYDKPYTKTVTFETELEVEEQTEENLVLELRNNAKEYLAKNKTPEVSYEIISDINQKLEIGDTIHVKHPLVMILTEVLEYEYDIILKRVKRLVFGNFTRNVKSKFDAIKENINKITESLSKQEVVINNQTNLINSLNKNGHVYIDDNEILILDTLPRSAAKCVWRFGLGGIGYSENGYEGPFKTAMTMDGQINADFITTGVMSVDRIEGLSNQLTIIIDEQKNIADKVENIEETSATVTGNKTIVLENCVEGNMLELHLYGHNTNHDFLFPADDLYPSEDLYPNHDEENMTAIYEIEIENEDGTSEVHRLAEVYWLSKNDEVFDEYVLKNGTASITRLVNIYDGTTQELKVEELGNKSIFLKPGKNTITLLNYSANISVKYVVGNEYTNNFATKTEMNSAIEMTAENINLSVEKKLEGYSTTEEMNAAINVKADEISSKVENVATYANIKNASGELHLTDTLEDDASILDLKIFGASTSGRLELVVDKQSSADGASEEAVTHLFELETKLLEKNGTYDEILIENSNAKLIRRLAENENVMINSSFSDGGINTGGKELDREYECRSDYTPVLVNKEYKLSKLEQELVFSYIFFYDTDKNLISYTNLYSAGSLYSAVFTTPSNCEYVRVTLRTEDLQPVEFSITEQSVELKLNKDDVYALDEEVTEDLGVVTIPTFENDTYIYVKNESLNYYCRYVENNDFTKTYATKTEVTQTAEKINVEVRKKVGNDEIIRQINLSSEGLLIDVGKFNINRSC